MTTVIKSKVSLSTDENGKTKIKRVYVMDSSKRKRVHVPAKRESDKWKDKSK